MSDRTLGKARGLNSIADPKAFKGSNGRNRLGLPTPPPPPVPAARPEPLPVRAPLADEPRPVQISEVSRHGGLGQPQQIDQVADAELPGHEHVQEPDPHGVGEAPEQEVEIGDGAGWGDHGEGAWHGAPIR